jgi:hypothetical protein
MLLRVICMMMLLSLVVGKVRRLSLNFERLDLAADSGLTIFTYTAEPGSRHDEALKLLGSWAATTEQDDPATRATDRT